MAEHTDEKEQTKGRGVQDASGMFGRATWEPAEEAARPADLARRAERGYQFDAEFHARVEVAVRVALDVLDIGRGEDSRQEEAARMGAALALVLADVPIAELIGGEAQL